MWFFIVLVARLAVPDQRDAFGIIVSYAVKVKLYLGALGGELSAELPFVLMHPKVIICNHYCDPWSTFLFFWYLKLCTVFYNTTHFNYSISCINIIDIHKTWIILINTQCRVSTHQLLLSLKRIYLNTCLLNFIVNKSAVVAVEDP